jgi:hypothetical protein
MSDSDFQPVISTVCTQRVLPEMLVFKYSLERLYPPGTVRWILCTDEVTTDYFAADVNIACTNCIEKSGSHWQSSEEAKETFFRLVTRKFDVVRQSIAAHGYALLLDTDMVFLQPFRADIAHWLADDSLDLVLSPDRSPKALRFNAGMVLVKNAAFVDHWEELTLSRKYHYEQGALNAAVATGRYRHELFSFVYNMAHWRRLTWQRMAFDTRRRGRISYRGEDVINLHIHLFSHHRIGGLHYHYMVQNMLRRLRRYHPELHAFHAFVRDCFSVEDGRCVLWPILGDVSLQDEYARFAQALGRVTIHDAGDDVAD